MSPGNIAGHFCVMSFQVLYRVWVPFFEMITAVRIDHTTSIRPDKSLKPTPQLQSR